MKDPILKWNDEKQLLDNGCIVGHIGYHLDCRDYHGYIRFGNNRYFFVVKGLSLSETKVRVKEIALEVDKLLKRNQKKGKTAGT